MIEISDEFRQIQNENVSSSNEIPVIENLQEFFKCPSGCPNGTSDLIL